MLRSHPPYRPSLAHTIPLYSSSINQCMSLDECLYGTFVTQGGSVKKHKVAHAEHLVRYGECWLAAQTHDTPVSCGVACKGFVKVAAPDVAPTTPPPNIEQANECQCDSTSEPEKYMRCMSMCKGHGLHTFQRFSCNCDPQTERSVFTMCRK